MILTKEQLENRRNDPNWTDVPDQKDFIDTIDAQSQTIAELTAKLDAVRGLADGLSQVCGDWGRSEGISKRILAILDAPTKPKEARE